MRDWNTLSKIVANVFENIWSLPMRDWNERWLLETTVDDIDLKPTYEGLKLIPQQLFWPCFHPFEAYLWGIETTGEEREKASTSHLKPTYEGLKLVKLINYVAVT